MADRDAQVARIASDGYTILRGLIGHIDKRRPSEAPGIDERPTTVVWDRL